MTINLRLQQETLAVGQAISAGSFVESATGIGGRFISEYAFFDSGNHGGHFLLNGVTQPIGQWIFISSSQLSSLQYMAGSSAGTENVYVAAWDGGWTTASTTATFTGIPTPPPSVMAASASVIEGQSIAASSFIASTTDPNGKAISQYSFMDAGSDGHLAYNGTVLAANHWYNFTAAQLAQLTYVAGTAVGTDRISIEVSDGGPLSAPSIATVTVTAPQGIASHLQDPGIAADVSRGLAGNSLSYGAMLTVLEDAASSAMTASKFATLQSLATMLNANNGISVSGYVQQIADDVIFGNSANAHWNGGSNTVALGNLTASSSSTQVQELIGKWFLGTDLPSLAGTGVAATYQPSSLPLYGSSGAPSNSDVSQGNLGDCYLLAALGETALRDPSAIQSMITSNGNGTEAVRFYVNGVADYVTVNNVLPVMAGGYQWANGSKLEFANGPVNWAALVEKAYVQLNEQSAVGYGTVGSVFENISGGDQTALSQITNQPVTSYNLFSNITASALNSIMSVLAAGWKAGDLMMLATPNASSGNLVGDHMFEVTGVNSATGTISLLNPWNTDYSGPLHMAFSETIQQLAADNTTLYDSALLSHVSGGVLLH